MARQLSQKDLKVVKGCEGGHTEGMHSLQLGVTHAFIATGSEACIHCSWE